MPYYQYKAFSNDGKPVNGLVEGTDTSSAIKLLKDKQLFVVSIKEKQEGGLFDFAKFKRVSFNDIVTFTRQLSTMITAGLSLPEALTILRAQTNNEIFAKVIQDIERQIIGGGNLGDALSKYPEHFSPIYISLVRAGEASGLLDKVLNRLAETLESQREFNNKVRGAMIYPIIIVIGMVAVVGIMMTVVMPKLMGLYQDFNITLPASTQALIAISNFSVKYWWLVIMGMIGSSIAFSKWKKTPAGESVVDGLILKLPLFGDLQKKSILVEFTRTLSMLISSGIHILDALKILQGSLANVHYRNAIEDVAKKVEKGFPLGDTFALHKEFPPIVPQMIKVGEETGKIDETLLKLSNYFQSEVENLVKGLTTAIEPIIMVVLGVGVGFIVISVITPIYQLTSQIQ